MVKPTMCGKRANNHRSASGGPWRGVGTFLLISDMVNHLNEPCTGTVR